MTPRRVNRRDVFPDDEIEYVQMPDVTIGDGEIMAIDGVPVVRVETMPGDEDES